MMFSVRRCMPSNLWGRKFRRKRPCGCLCTTKCISVCRLRHGSNLCSRNCPWRIQRRQIRTCIFRLLWQCTLCRRAGVVQFPAIPSWPIVCCRQVIHSPKRGCWLEALLFPKVLCTLRLACRVLGTCICWQILPGFRLVSFRLSAPTTRCCIG